MTLSYKIHTATTGDVNGNSLGYHFSFPSLSENDITVTVAGSPKNNPADYTIGNWTADAGQNPYIEFTSSTARGSGTIRISRGTTSSSPTHDFQVGSAIKAADLNTCNKQNIYLAQENRDSINALALGDASSAIQIDSANIKNLTIQAIDLATDAVETNKIKDLNVTTGKIADNAITNNKVDTNAAIQGTKISPDFGSQNITTTGTFSSGDITISDASPRILFTETDADPDWKVVSVGGEFRIHDETNDEDRVIVNQDGHVDVKSHLDVSGGADITGNLTVTGDATFNNGISSNGKDVYTNNGAFITLDHPHDPFKTDRSTSTNVDHIWHDDGDNAWNFCSDTDYKTTGNSKVKAGSFYGDGANITNLPTPPISKVAYVRQSSDSTAPSNNTSWNTAGSLTRTVTAVTNDTFVWVQWFLQFTTNNATSNTMNRAMYRIRLYKNGSHVKDVLPEVSTTMTSNSTTTNEQAFKLVQDGTGDFTTGEQIEIRVQYKNYTSGTSRRTVLKSGSHLAVFLVDVN